jgi:hypothetical protein
MKKLLPILLVAVIAITFAACSNKSQTDANNTGTMLTPADTTGLADFQKWKQLNELKNYMMYQQEAAYTQPVKKTTTVHRTTSKPKTVSMTSTDQYPAKTVQKKGWSSKAKGAVIGGGSGAILGALLDKNHRVTGASLGVF